MGSDQAVCFKHRSHILDNDFESLKPFLQIKSFTDSQKIKKKTGVYFILNLTFMHIEIIPCI